MKKFKLEEPFLEIFPEARIGILVCRGINNQPTAEDKYAAYLKEAGQAAMQYVTEPEFTANPVIRTWRDAFYKFRTKKGARCSIEAMLKRVSKGDTIGCINPLVDLYNGVSLRYGVPVGGENIDAFQGDMRLTVAEGGEDFVTYGSDKSEPPYEGEVVYKDDGGAICRCFNWRESVRTMLTEDTVNAFMCIETVSEADVPRMLEAQEALKKLIEDELCRPDGKVTAYVLDRDHREVVIEE
ncbi:MAG: B3/4 domain-containing protein [Firmicutes bacterium]|nr:B3/4 domain-containing protein [Bacillota bacterium]